MMVEGFVQKQKVREGHWVSGENGGNLRIKLDEKPVLGTTEEVVLRYGQTKVVVKVVLTSWNATYNEVFAEVLR